MSQRSRALSGRRARRRRRPGRRCAATAPLGGRGDLDHADASRGLRVAGRLRRGPTSVPRARGPRRRRRSAPRGPRPAASRTAGRAREVPLIERPKIAPPRLFGTTITRSDGSRARSRATHPRRRAATGRRSARPSDRVPAVATPSAVETRPSMPLAPRFASTWRPSRGAIATSRSRIGVEFPTNNAPRPGRPRPGPRQTSSVGSSVASSTSSSARRACMSRCQDARHPSGAGSTRRPLSSAASASGLVAVADPPAAQGRGRGGGGRRRGVARRRRRTPGSHGWSASPDLQHDLRTMAFQESRRRDERLTGRERRSTRAVGAPTWVPRAAAIRAVARAARPRSRPSTSSSRRRPRRARPTARERRDRRRPRAARGCGPRGPRARGRVPRSRTSAARGGAALRTGS